MDLLLYNAPSGLKPCYDEDYENKKRLKVGEYYKAKVTLARNIDFHRKYMSLMRTAWEYQQEKSQGFFHNSFESFRKSIELTAGCSERIYNITTKQWEEHHKSIAFDKMDQFEFEDLYKRVKDVLFTIALTHVGEDEFMSNLIDY